MEHLFTILPSVIIGILIGVLFCYILFRVKKQSAYEKGLSESSNGISILNERLESRNSQIEELRSTEKLKDDEIKEFNEKIVSLKSNIAELETKLADERKQTEEKLKLLDESKAKLSAEFKNLANEIFDDKSKKFNESSKTNLESLLKPLGEKIKDFEKKVEETHEKGVKDRTTLIEKISQLHDLNKQLSEDALSLTNALKGDSKTQGNWGELVLEKILEVSGLEKGREYDVQESFNSEDGKRYQPDVIIKLPGNRNIIIDSKVSLNAYEKHFSETDNIKKEKSLKEHINSIKKHIKELGEKNYQHLYEIESLDFVLMFVPIEPAFTLAIRTETNLFLDALSKNVVIVTPSTLLATLRTVAHTWKQEYQNKNASEIARKSGALYDKFLNFVKDLEEIGSRLTQAQQSYDNAMNKIKSGKGNLVKRAEDIRLLGAKVKEKLPEKIIEESND